MRVVLDTNIFISGLNFSGNERLVLELARRGRFELYLSPFILQETVGVLTRKFGWSE
ncbi:MAG: PIN domain-containing protein, partial [Caldilineaceae bacterium SB0670_bin_27]|nr:PIN domain-containing protein [Caldilineaceae bacterium SB0670_bin_27]